MLIRRTMNEATSTPPLANILRAANGLVKAGIIENYALGGALAVIRYVEPFDVYEAVIFFIPADKSLTAGMPAIYAHLQSKGWQVEEGHLTVKGFPVQFLAAHGLTEEAVREARRIKVKNVPAKVFRAEHIVAIAASGGRPKDIARIEQMQQQAKLDQALLEKILRQYQLQLPRL